jgi:hypothetical protein
MSLDFVHKIYSSILAVTVPVLHPVRSACGSLFSRFVKIHYNIPSMPLSDAHLGGFFFLGEPSESFYGKV